MYLHNIGGYGPGSPFYGSFGEYIVPEWQMEQIRKHLGHRFTGFDVGEQDGRFNFTYKQIMEPYIPDRRRQYPSLILTVSLQIWETGAVR